MLSRLVRPVVRVAQRGVRQYHADEASFKYATMNELPVPSGSWQTAYDARQKKYNLQLATGIIVFIVTFTIAKASGALYLNATIPVASKKSE